MSVNLQILIGNTGKAPEVTHLEGGRTVAKFTIATSESYKTKGGEKKTDTTWHNIVAWSSLAEFAEKYITKGMQLYIEGKTTNRSYEDKEGIKRYTTEVVAHTIRFVGKKEDGANNAHTQTQGSELPEPDEMTASQNDGSENLPF